jgi:hypothetical protein
MFLGDKVGLKRVLDVVERVSKNVPDIKVSNLLRKLANEGKTFASLEPQPIKV